MGLKILWFMFYTLSETSQLRRSISKKRFRGFLGIYQNFRHVMRSVIVLDMYDGMEHSNLFGLCRRIHPPLSESHFGETMTRQWESLFRWYDPFILSKKTLNGFLNINTMYRDGEMHKLIFRLWIQTFRPNFNEIDSNRLRGFRRDPSERTRRHTIVSSKEQRLQCHIYLIMLCIQGQYPILTGDEVKDGFSWKMGN